MRVVGSRDRHGLDAVRPFRFAGEQRAIVRIAPTLGDGEFEAECASAIRVDVKGARDEVEGPVAQRGRTVDVADLAAGAAADHRPADRLLRLPLADNHGTFLLWSAQNPTLRK